MCRATLPSPSPPSPPPPYSYPAPAVKRIFLVERGLNRYDGSCPSTLINNLRNVYFYDSAQLRGYEIAILYLNAQDLIETLARYSIDITARMNTFVPFADFYLRSPTIQRDPRWEVGATLRLADLPFDVKFVSLTI